MSGSADPIGGGPRARAGIRAGAVLDYDFDRGLGSVGDEAGVTYPFHATAIADGSRMIEAGTAVVFTLRPGHLGRIQARDLRPIAPLG